MAERRKAGFFVSVVCLLLLMSSAQVAADAPRGKRTIGETAVIAVEQAGMSFLARIDTGARVTSIHAMDVEVKHDAGDDKKDNIGKEVSFTTENERHKWAKVTTSIVDVAKVRNAQGTEYRYVVELKLKWQGIEKSALVNLRDRSAMSYKLLIGRNWLSSDFIVDVDRSEGIIK